MLNITPEAQKALEQVFGLAETGTLGVRIDVGRGCAGLSYAMAFESSLREADTLVNCGPVPVILDPISHFLLDGAEIRFEDSPEGGGFVFHNPNSVTSGCSSCKTASSSQEAPAYC